MFQTNIGFFYMLSLQICRKPFPCRPRHERFRAAREFPAAAAARSAPPIQTESQAPYRKAHPTGNARPDTSGKKRSPLRFPAQSAQTRAAAWQKEHGRYRKRTGSVTGGKRKIVGLSNQKLQAGNFVKRSRTLHQIFQQRIADQRRKHQRQKCRQRRSSGLLANQQTGASRQPENAAVSQKRGDLHSRCQPAAPQMFLKPEQCLLPQCCSLCRIITVSPLPFRVFR